jgi:ankyrin repeat protein
VRIAFHVAASEGKVAAVKVLVEWGADPFVKDRWNHSVNDAAKNSNSIKVMKFLDSIKK